MLKSHELEGDKALQLVLFNRLIFQNRMNTDKASVKAARDVLVNGFSHTEAAAKHLIGKSLVTMTVKRVRETKIVFTDIEKALLSNELTKARSILEVLRKSEHI